MAVQKNTITINGRIYDTTTGKIIQSIPIQLPKQVSSSPIAPKSKPKTVDGFVRVSNQNIKPAKKLPSTAKKIARSQPISATGIHKKTERTHTLMRQTVEKPLVNQNKTVVAVSNPVQQPEHYIIQSNTASLKRPVNTVSKSSMVHKFSSQMPKVIKRTEYIPVKNPPSNYGTSEEQVSAPTQAPPISQKQPSIVQKNDIFEQALSKSTSHLNSYSGGVVSSAKKSKQKFLHVASFVAVVLLVIGYLAYINIPSLNVRMASSRVGFTATMPRYKPTGYRLNRTVKIQDGRVAIEYDSAIDNRSFVLTQEKSNLDSASMESTYLNKTKDKFRVTTANGKNVYIFNKTNATWIDGGILFTITSNAMLSPDQLIKLASSL